MRNSGGTFPGRSQLSISFDWRSHVKAYIDSLDGNIVSFIEGNLADGEIRINEVPNELILDTPMVEDLKLLKAAVQKLDDALEDGLKNRGRLLSDIAFKAKS
jgi:hypothetical protein